jgi:TorA maturation chaperone TorD
MQSEFSRTDWVTFFTGEALAAGLLGKILYTYPEKAWFQSLADEDVFAESPIGSEQQDVQSGLALLQSWTKTVRGGMSAELFDELRVDYTRLMFSGDRVLAPPWESVYFSEERMLFQEQTMQVRVWYRRFGVDAANHAHEPDDHIGLEFAFIAHLANLALVALEQDESADFENVLAAQREFLSEHLMKWALQWCDLVETHANTEFFRGIALLTKGILAELTAILHITRVSEVTLRTG